MVTSDGARSLKTAAAALRALRLLGDHPQGLSSQDLGTLLGKSAATARYLLNTLCATGFATRDPGGRCRLSATPPWGPWRGSSRSDDPRVRAVLTEGVTELYRRTRQRSYLVRPTGAGAVIEDVRGHQGLARVPGLEDTVPGDRAHALGLTKALLAQCPHEVGGFEADGPLAGLTEWTRTDPDDLRADLSAVRSLGYSVDVEEFTLGFATVAVPVTCPVAPVTVSLGVSLSVRRIGQEREEVAAALLAVADDVRSQWADALSDPPR